MSVNKFVSGGIEQMRIIQLNSHFPTVLASKFGVYIIQVCILYLNFCSIITAIVCPEV